MRPISVRQGERLLAAIRGLSHASRALEHDCERAGLTLAQYRLLDFIRIEPVRAGALAEKAAISRPNLTTIMDTLETRGLIVRDRVPGDRRGVSLEVTDAGVAALVEAEGAFAKRLTEQLRPSELRSLLAGLGVLADASRRRG